MRRRMLVTAAALATAAAGALLAPATAAAQELPFQRGDTGPAVQRWQSDLNLWFRMVTPANRGPLQVDGIHGPNTEEATEEFQRGQGLPVTGEVDLRTRRTMDGVLSRQIPTAWQQRALEWPLVVPSWFWEWGRWYLGRSEYQGRARDQSVRPAAAPQVIPRWAWRRMNVMNGQPPERRAEAFARDRIRELTGAPAVTAHTSSRSDRDPYWALVTGETGADRNGAEPMPTGWAMWMRINANRWTGWQITRLRDDDPNLRPDWVPCDVRPAFSEPEC